MKLTSADVASNIPRDDEKFSTRDHCVRRKIYGKFGFELIQEMKTKNLKFLTVLNFGKSDFQEGATCWAHLKQYPLSLLLAHFNGAAYALGNKTKFTSSATGGGKKGRPSTKVPSSTSSYNNTTSYSNDKMVVIIETLFHKKSTTKVFGFRIFFFEISSGGGSPPNTLSGVPLKTTGDVDNGINEDNEFVKLPTSLLSKGINDAFPECREVITQWDKAKNKKGAFGASLSVGEKVNKELDRSLAYMKNDTFQGLYHNVFSTYYVQESFRTERCYIDPRTNIVGNVDLSKDQQYFIDDRNTLELTDVARLFSVDAAMLYGVINKVHTKQCNIGTYFKHTYNPDTSDGDDESLFNKRNESLLSSNVVHLGNTTFHNHEFVGFYNHDTTYVINSKMVLPEFIYKMPLPHCIGSTLKCKEDESASSSTITNEQIKGIVADDDNDIQKEGDEIEQNEDAMDYEEEQEPIIYGSDDEDHDSMINPLFVKTMRLHQKKKNIHNFRNDRCARIESDNRSAYVQSDDENDFHNKSHERDDDDDDNNNNNNDDEEEDEDFHLDKEAKTILKSFSSAVASSIYSQKTPLGIHSTNHIPSHTEVLQYQRIGRFAKLDRNVTPKTIDDYKNIQESIVSAALIHSLSRLTLKEKSFYTSDYEKLWVDATSKNPIEDLPFCSDTTSSSPYSFLTVNNDFATVEDDDEDEENEDDDNDDDEDGNSTKNKPRKSREELRTDRKRKEFDEYIRSKMWEYDFTKDMSDSEKTYQCHLATANLEMFKETIRKYRPLDNDADTVLKLGLILSHSHKQIEKDIFCRLFELNTLAYNTLDRKFYGDKSFIEKSRENEYMKERRKLMEALVVECYYEFMNNPDVTPAAKELRKYFETIHKKTNEGLVVNPISCSLTDFRIDVRPYDHYRIWTQKFYTSQDGLDVKSNYKNMDIIFHARYHHCRHFLGTNLPAKLNIMVQGKPGGGKSFQVLQAIACMIFGIVIKLNQMTGNALLVDANLSDSLILFEEIPPELLGTEAGNNSASDNGYTKSNSNNASDNGATFKAILTSGESSKLRATANKDTGEVTQVKSTALLQVNVFGTLNPTLAGRELGLLDRFVLLHQTSAKDGSSPLNATPDMYKDLKTNKHLVNEAIDIHRIYYITEMMMKANILGCNPGCGVNMTVADVLINQVLDNLQDKYSIPTGNPRKRKFVSEMARCKRISFVVWQALKSPLFRHLHHFPNLDPTKKEYIGFNLRIFIYAIIPFLFITKAEAFDSLILMSGVWQSDHLVDILTYLTNESKFVRYLKEYDMNLLKKKSDQPKVVSSPNTTTVNNTGGTSDNLLLQSAILPPPSPQQQNIGTRRRRTTDKALMTNEDFTPFYKAPINGEEDCNYICIRIGTKRDQFMKKIATSAVNKKTDLSEKYISKILEDLSEEYSEELPSYCVNIKTRRLVHEVGSPRIRRKIVDYVRHTSDGVSYCLVLISFLKNRLPHILTDDLVENLTKIEDDKNEDNIEIIDDEEFTIKSSSPSFVKPNESTTTTTTTTTTKKKVDKTENEEVEYYEGIINKIVMVENEGIQNNFLASIKNITENPALERARTLGVDEFGRPKEWISEKQDEEWTKQYASSYFKYIISEPLKTGQLSEVFDDVPKLTRKQASKEDIIYLDHHLGKMELSRKDKGPYIRINNKNYQSDIAQSTLSTSNSLFNVDLHPSSNSSKIMMKQYDPSTTVSLSDILVKRRIALYNKSAVVVIKEDIDWEVMKAHFMELGFKFECTTGDPLQQFMAFPTFMYMITTKFYNSIALKYSKLFPDEANNRALTRLNYPDHDVDQDLDYAHAQLQSKYALELDDSSKVVNFSSLVNANHENSENWLALNSFAMTQVNEQAEAELKQFQLNEYINRQVNRHVSLLKHKQKRLREEVSIPISCVINLSADIGSNGNNNSGGITSNKKSKPSQQEEEEEDEVSFNNGKRTKPSPSIEEDDIFLGLKTANRYDPVNPHIANSQPSRNIVKPVTDFMNTKNGNRKRL
jgi:hypothetical protein